MNQSFLGKKYPPTSAKAKGERLKRIRRMANLSREEFCADGEINITTLISWEVGRFGGLSSKGISKVLSRVAKEGVICSSEWLMYEEGAGPEVRVDYNRGKHVVHDVDHNESDEEAIIMEELLTFRRLNKNSVDFIIEDDSMFPAYQRGDYVAGTMRFGDAIAKLIGMDCIVQIKDGQLMVRNIQCGPGTNTYNLISKNLNAKCHETIVYNIELTSASPIIWHRRRQPATV